MTEIKGNYDFALEFSPEDFRAMLDPIGDRGWSSASA